MFGDDWPTPVPLRLHLGANDPFVDEDRDAALSPVAHAADGELHEHDTAEHLTIDPSSPGHDAQISARILTVIGSLLQ